jgi:uncharacterized damage-inducible protein DinB
MYGSSSCGNIHRLLESMFYIEDGNMHDLIDSWHISNRVNLYLLESIPAEALDAEPTGMKGRSVAALFAHMHNARLMWLEVVDPKIQVARIPTRTKADKAAITHDVLREALTTSAEALALAVQKRMESGKIGVFKPHPAGFISYLIAHEGYHRGEICMTLTEAGHKLPDEILSGMWEWDKR